MYSSKQLFEEAKNRMPGGVNSPVRAFRAVGHEPRFIEKGSGAYLCDVDQRIYIDYVCSWGAAILGHAHPQVVDAVQRAAVDGLSFGAPTRREVKLAEYIQEAFPSMELLRMVSSGTEAVMSAIRVARAYTGRDKILKFQGNYHGHSDGLLVKAGSGAITMAAPDSTGVPEGYRKNTVIATYNNEDSVRECMELHKGEIAAIIVEPVAANMGLVQPKEGFLQFLRNITKEYDSLLIFDEVITGFRFCYGGMQMICGIEPDLTTLGKIVGGGMPLAVYGGKKEIMEHVSPLGNVYQAGTLSGNPIATAAGIATLEILKENREIYLQIDQHAKHLAQTLRQRAIERKESIFVNQYCSLLSVFFTEEKVVDYESAMKADTKKYAEFFHEMLAQNIYLPPSQFETMFVSAAHSEADIKKTCDMILHAGE